MRVLVADIGGTHARVAAIEATDRGMRVVHSARYVSRDHPGLASVIRGFVAESGLTFERACIGVACPITEGVCDAPNLPWQIRTGDVSERTGIPHVTLINDFEALGHAIAHLDASDTVTLQAGVPTIHGPIALIGAGTGLGQSFLLWDGERYRVHASEGGHSTLAAQTEREWGFVRHFAEEFGHVSYERVLSGPGLVNVYRYLASAHGVPPDSPVSLEVDREGPPAVTRHALDATDPICVETLDFFASVYGSQAGNAAMSVMATGGVFLGGGIAAHTVAKLRDGAFLRTFRGKGRLTQVLERIPVHVIVNTDAALVGAAAVAFRLERSAR